MVVFLLQFLYYHVRIQTNTKGGNIGKRILSLIVGFCLVIGLFFPFTTGAASKAEERLDVQVEATTNSIKLSWTGIADHYEVIEGGKEEKKIWSGAKTSFTQKGLESGRSYSYIIAAYDKEKKLITKANVSSSTLKTDAQVKKELSSLKDEYHPMVEARLEAIQEENEIRLVWHDLPDEDGEYEVYRDNKLYAKVKGNEYKVKHHPEEVRDYAIVGYKKLPQGEIERIKSILKKENVKLTKEEEKEVFYERNEVGIIVDLKYTERRKSANKRLENYTPNDDDFTYPDGVGYLVRYATFIPDARVPDPWCELLNYCKYDEFAGDDRDFDFWSDSFRTRSTAYVTWDYNRINPNPVAMLRQTGITIGYYDDIYEDSAQADYRDIKLENEDRGSDWIYHEMTMASKNPLLPEVLTPAIDASYKAKIYKTLHNSEFSGKHDRAPSHEIYLAEFPGHYAWALHQHEHEGFDHLLPLPTHPKCKWSRKILIA